MAMHPDAASAAQLGPRSAPSVIDTDDPHETRADKEQPLPSVQFHGIASLPPLADRSFDGYKSELFNLIESRGTRSTSEQDIASLPQKILELYIKIFTIFPSQRTLSYEKLVASYVSLWTVLENPEYQQYRSQALLGLRALSLGDNKVSTNIFREIEFQTSTPAALTYVMRGVVTFIRALFYVAIIVSYPIVISNYYFSLTFWGDILAGAPVNIIVAAMCGMLGSVISILLRLSEFETTRGRSQTFLILTGATLPLVGGVFGAFVASLLSAKIVNIAIGGQDPLNIWLYVVLGFLSGFSERFSRGFIEIAANRFVGTGGSLPSPTTAPQTATILGTAELARNKGKARSVSRVSGRNSVRKS